MARATSLTEEEFLKNVANHEVKVLLDNGIYRHLHCQKPGSSNQWFDIVTWPGFLAYTGDMGAFTFTRLADMFEFFRSDRDKDHLGINPDYWSEKLEAVDREGRRGCYSEFSEARFREHVEDTIKEWVEDYSVEFESDEEEEVEQRKAFEVELRQSIDDEVYHYLEDGQHEARKALNEFSFTPTGKRFNRTDRKYEFTDTWEWDCEDFTLRFIWCCYAMVWAIQKYDEQKAEIPTEAA